MMMYFPLLIALTYIYFTSTKATQSPRTHSSMDLFLSSLQPLLFLACLFPLSLYFIFKNKKTITSSLLTDYPILGNLPGFLKNRHRFLEWSTAILASTKTNTMTFRRPGKVKGIITANPLNVEHMLKTNFTNYPKGERFIHLLEDFLGGGIFNSDDDLWRIQRKTASYEFSTKSLRSFIIDNVRMEIQTRLIPVLQKSTKSGEMVNLQDVLERFAFDNICSLAFNVDAGCLGGDGEKNIQGTEFMRAFDEAATLSAGRFMYAVTFLWKFKKFFDIGSEKTLRESIKKVHDFAEKIITSKLMKKEEKNDEYDLLSRFMTTTGTDWESAKFLRDVVISFILAGKDTTSSALSWFFWLLASHPSVEQNILDELKASRKRNGTSIGDTLHLIELRDLHYLHAAISESMRLYPPVAVDTKACLVDDVMPDGTFIGKGWFATYQTYAMGRMESIWGKDCLEYKPERWLENGTFRVESPFRYPVFHAGQRMCLGKDMAYIQMKSIAACVLERFQIEVIGKEKEPEHVLSLTLRMKHGLMVRVKERCLE